MARNALIQVRRDTAANWTSVNPTLAAGEIGFETDTGKLKVGTGSTAWTSLLYATDASDITGATLASNVTASSLTSVGTLGSLAVSGDLTVDTNTLKVDSTNNRVGVNTTSPGTALDVIGTITARSGATQDGVALAGRAGGTSSYEVTLQPTTLTADRTITLPDTTGDLAAFTSARGSNTGWTSFTTTINQGVNVTFGTYVSRYAQIGKMINWQFALLISGTGTAGNAVRISLPQTFQANATYAIAGNMHIYDQSANVHYSGIAFAYSSTQVGLIPHANSNYFGSGAIAITTGDVISGHIIYEAA